MKRLLRSCIDFDGQITPEQLVQNFQKVTQARIEWNRPDDAKVYDFLASYFQQRLEMPSAQTVTDYFDKTGDLEANERLKDIAAAPWYVRTNFAHLITTLLEEQNRIKATTLLKEAHEIINKGLIIQEGREKIRKQGVREGLIYFTQKAHDLVLSDFNARTAGDIRLDGQAMWDSYLDAKVNKDKVWGKFTGLNNIDSVSHGIKKGELWIHAAFPGELKCLAGDVTVYDHRTNRRRTLQEMYETGDVPVVTALDREGETFRLIRTPASHLVQNGVREVFDLTLSSGRTIGATDNHKFFTPTGWKELSTLREGDWVATPKQMSFEGQRLFTDAEVKVVGYLIGDGSLTKDITLTASNEEIRRDFMACLIDMGLVKGAADYVTPTFREVFQPNRAPSVRVSNSAGDGNSPMESPVRGLLDLLGLYGKGSYDKRVPDDFFSLPEDQVALLIGALWSTDGSCHHGDHERDDRESDCHRNDISYASVSRGLCLDVQALLLRLGIQSTVTQVNTTYRGEPYTFHTVRVVTRESKRVFAHRVVVVGKEADFAEVRARLLPGDDMSIPSDFVPDGAKVPFVHGKFRYASQVKGRSTMRADTATLFRQYPDVARVLDGDLTWEQVTSVVSRGREMTYDLSVPEHHTFVANDIVTHNTSFALNWCYNLVTRYKSNILYYSLEMPYEQLRLQVYVIHSSHAKWRAQGYRPLDYRRVRDGELTPEEEAFYQKVIDDFCNNPEYCQFEIRSPDRDMTIDDIRLDAELTHKQMEVGLIVIDHGQLMEARKAKKSKDYVVELNSIIRDTKKFCLHFNHGEKIPALMLFQINRQGKEEANKNDGRYKASALSYANECVAEGTLVLTDEGLVPIESVPMGALVWSRSGWKTVLNRFDNGVRPTLRVQTDKGLTLQVTSNHRLRVGGLDGWGWGYAENLKVGDYVGTTFGDYPFAKDPPNLPALDLQAYEKPQGMKQQPLVVPNHLTSDLAYLIGAFMGDGVFKEGLSTVGFTGNRKEVAVRTRLMEAFRSTFGQDMTLLESPSRSGSFDLLKSNKALTRWFKRVVVGEGRATAVPDVIRRATKSQVQAFLQGLFDTDGSINNQGSVALGMAAKSERLLQEVHLMLLGLGIDSTLSEGSTRLNGKSYKRFVLRIGSRLGVRTFMGTVGFTEPHKTERLRNVVGSTKDNRATWPIGTLLADVVERCSGMSRAAKKAARRIRMGAVYASLGVIREVIDRLPETDPDRATLQERLDCVLPLKVTGVVQEAPIRVYDLEVTGDHEYSTNGFLSHNCEKSADVITTTYLNDEHRKNGTTLFCNLKNRDNPLIEPFMAKVEFACRRIYNLDSYQGADGSGMSIDDHQAVLDAMADV